MLGGNRWLWDRILAGFSPMTQTERDMASKLSDLISVTTPSNSEDVIKWRWDRSELFSVKSLYNFLQDGGVSDRSFLQLWKVRALLKVKIFVWIVLK